MTRNPDILFFYQTFAAFLALIFVAVGFMTAWGFFYLQEFRDRRRPGINLKEL